jgi:transposase
VIPKELEAKIVRLHLAERWRIGTIARELALHHTTVRRVLARLGVPTQPHAAPRASILDPYRGLVHEILEKYPGLHASRLYAMLRERGYPGGPDHFRHLVALLRPRAPAEAFLRLRTLPGEQAQVDWGAFGRVTIGRAERRLSAFVMVLSWSRALFARFFLDQQMASFLRGHVEAFEHFGGSVRVVLYDNLRSAVLERVGDAIRFHPELLALATHYRYEPRPVAIARGNEKGRVERAIQYLRTAFFAARPWTSLDDLNAQALAFCTGPARERRCPEDKTLSVGQAFQQEQPHLLALPADRPATDERVEVSVGRTPYVRFDGNDYSVPATAVHRPLSVVASETTVRVLDGPSELARHARSYSRGEQIEDPAHVEALVAHKREAREQRALDRLAQATPRSRELLVQLAARGGNLGSATAALGRLLDRYGAEALQVALDEALARGVPHPQAVRQVLERRRREQHAPPPVAVALPDDPRVRGLVVTPHRLETYDPPLEETASDDDPSEDPR